MNFIPTRPLEDIAREYVNGFWSLYEPGQYLDRTYRHYMKLGIPKHIIKRKIDRKTLKALLTLCWRQGVIAATRGKFWYNMIRIYLRSPRLVPLYFISCAYIEHFTEYRQMVRDKINAQLAAYLATKQEQAEAVVKV